MLLSAVSGTPRLTIAVVLLLLVALATTFTYTGYLVVGVLADQLGTSRFLAGLLLGGVFARFPKVSQGRLRMAGLLPKPVRRPAMLCLLAFCLASLVVQGAHGPAAVTGFTTAFLLGFPWLKRAFFARVTSSMMHFAPGRGTPSANDDTVIEGEFREKKE